MRTSNPLAFAVLLILLAFAIFPSTVHSAAADGILYLHRDNTDILYDRHNVNSTLPKIIIYESPEGSYWTATPEQFYFKGVHEVHEVIRGINLEELWTMIQTLEEVDRDGGVWGWVLSRWNRLWPSRYAVDLEEIRMSLEDEEGGYWERWLRHWNREWSLRDAFNAIELAVKIILSMAVFGFWYWLDAMDFFPW